MAFIEWRSFPHGHPPLMYTIETRTPELSEAWIDTADGVRWRSAQALGRSRGASALGASYLEVAPGERLGRHVDSAEEAVVVLAGEAEVVVGDDVPKRLGHGGVALVPRDVPHEVLSVGTDTLRFLALYSEPEVTTTYVDEVQSDGGRERESAS